MSIGDPVISIVDAAGGGDFTTMATWESTQQRNLVTSDEEEICQITSSGFQAGGIQVAGWTTDQNHKITIMPYNADGYHNGINGVGERASIRAVGASWGIYVNGVPNVHINNIHVGSGSTYGIILRASGCRIDGCMIDGSSGATNFGIYAFSTNWGGNPSWMYNTVIHGALTGVYVNNTSAANPVKMVAINCTIDALSSRCFYANGAGARIFSENNLLEATTIYGSAGGGIVIRGQRDATSNTTATNAALRNIAMTTAVVNPDNGILSPPWNYHLDTTPGPTIPSGLAGSGLLPRQASTPGGSGNAFDFELETRPMSVGNFSIGADQWNKNIDRDTSNALFGA